MLLVSLCDQESVLYSTFLLFELAQLQKHSLWTLDCSVKRFVTFNLYFWGNPAGVIPCNWWDFLSIDLVIVTAWGALWRTLLNSAAHLGIMTSKEKNAEIKKTNWFSNAKDSDKCRDRSEEKKLHFCLKMILS